MGLCELTAIDLGVDTVTVVTVVLVAIVVITASAHFAFLLYVVVGGFLALRWPRTLALHVAAVGWAVGSAVFGVSCPLTDVERWARRGAGMAEMPGSGFIDYYIVGNLFPADAAGTARVLFFGTMFVSWAVLGVVTARRRHGRHRERVPVGGAAG